MVKWPNSRPSNESQRVRLAAYIAPLVALHDGKNDRAHSETFHILKQALK